MSLKYHDKGLLNLTICELNAHVIQSIIAFQQKHIFL